ncbi:FecR family protein [Azorhizophilus paspali]|uniref:FecR domain-containing protein n=1 Tax=Azorhizophilus paspali TaxID=69963 RepID=A0ABV6SIH5_AZOPA
MPALPDDELDQPLPLLIEEALQWLVRLHAGDAADDDWLAYEQWCRSSPEHRSAALVAERLWQELGSVLRRPPRRIVPIVGALLALGLGLVLSWQGHERGWMADHRTAMGEHRHLELADGSQLELAPETRLDLDFDARRRTLRLYAGELYVRVASDPARPFLVEAADGSIRALGTGFDVRREGSRVRLVVTEHAVRVSRGDERIDVQAGQSLEYGEHGLSAPVAVDIDSATAWRRHRLLFDGQPLGEVLDALSRYQPGLLLVRDERLRRLPVTGLFDTRDPDALLELLERSLPIRVRRLPWVTLIEPDDSRP